MTRDALFASDVPLAGARCLRVKTRAQRRARAGLQRPARPRALLPPPTLPLYSRTTPTRQKQIRIRLHHLQ